MAEYGTIRAIVALFPRHNAKNPCFFNVSNRNFNAFRVEYVLSLKITKVYVFELIFLVFFKPDLKINLGPIQRRYSGFS